MGDTFLREQNWRGMSRVILDVSHCLHQLFDTLD
jgi:hypothetical protein